MSEYSASQLTYVFFAMKDRKPPVHKLTRLYENFCLSCGAGNLCLPILQNLLKRAGAQLFQRKTGQIQRFLLRKSAAVDGSQEIIEQTLSSRRIVENIADERCLRRLCNKVA